MSALVQGFACSQLLHGVFPGRLSRLEDTSWCPALLLPCPPDSGSHSLLVPLSLDMQVSGASGRGQPSPPWKWVVPRCGPPRLWQPSASPLPVPPAARLGRGWSPRSLGGCSRACGAGTPARGWRGCAGVSPLPRHRKPRAGGAGREAGPSAWLRPAVGVQVEPPRAVGRRVGFPGLACVSPPRFTFSSHSTRLPR